MPRWLSSPAAAGSFFSAAREVRSAVQLDHFQAVIRLAMLRPDFLAKVPSLKQGRNSIHGPMPFGGQAILAGMDGALAEGETERRVTGIGRHAPDDVTGIDVFEVDLHGVFLEIVPDGITQINADVSVFDITRSEGSWGPRDVPRIDPPSS